MQSNIGRKFEHFYKKIQLNASRNRITAAAPLSQESKVFGKLSRFAPSYPPTVYFVLLKQNSYPAGHPPHPWPGWPCSLRPSFLLWLAALAITDILLISAKVWKDEPFCGYLQGLCPFHTGLRTGTVEGQPATYAF